MKAPPSQGRLTVFTLLLLGATFVALIADPAIASAASSKAPAQPRSAAPIRVTFGIEPASTTGADGRPNFSFGVTPGAVLFDQVALLNYSTVPLTLQVYARDAIETTEGGFGLLPAAATSRGVGAWISGPPGDAAVLVPPRTSSNDPGQTVVPFTLRVPAGAEPGDHVGGIIATLQTEGKNASGQRVVLDQRVGTRVFVRVSGQIAPKVAVRDVHAGYSGTIDPFGQGTVDVRYVVANVGNVDVGLTGQTVSVSGLVADSHSGRFAPIPLLLPGSSVSEVAVIHGVWPQFLLHSSVTVDPVLTNGTGSEPLNSVSASTTVWAIPWALLVLILVILAVVVYLRRGRKASRATPSRPTAERVPVAA